MIAAPGWVGVDWAKGADETAVTTIAVTPDGVRRIESVTMLTAEIGRIEGVVFYLPRPDQVLGVALDNWARNLRYQPKVRRRVRRLAWELINR